MPAFQRPVKNTEGGELGKTKCMSLNFDMNFAVILKTRNFLEEMDFMPADI